MTPEKLPVPFLPLKNFYSLFNTEFNFDSLYDIREPLNTPWKDDFALWAPPPFSLVSSPSPSSTPHRRMVAVLLREAGRRRTPCLTKCMYEVYMIILDHLWWYIF
jgi:hypothetical protein